METLNTIVVITHQNNDLIAKLTEKRIKMNDEELEQNLNIDSQIIPQNLLREPIRSRQLASTFIQSDIQPECKIDNSEEPSLGHINLRKRQANLNFNDDELLEESVRKSPSPERRPQHPSTIKCFIWNDQTAKMIAEKQNKANDRNVELWNYSNNDRNNPTKFQIDLTSESKASYNNFVLFCYLTEYNIDANKKHNVQSISQIDRQNNSTGRFSSRNNIIRNKANEGIKKNGNNSILV